MNVIRYLLRDRTMVRKRTSLIVRITLSMTADWGDIITATSKSAPLLTTPILLQLLRLALDAQVRSRDFAWLNGAVVILRYLKVDKK